MDAQSKVEWEKARWVACEGDSAGERVEDDVGCGGGSSEDV